jgi:anthranilate phosphoribosyltransferase
MKNNDLSSTCRDYVVRLIRHSDLSANEVETLFNLFLQNPHEPLSESDNTLLGGLLVGLAAKGETVQEIVGAARCMRHHSSKIQVIGSPVVDIVGTGGDVLQTFNISTTSSFVAAGAGVVIAKHGNRAVSSRCGSADVLEACGINLNCSAEQVEFIVSKIGIGFMFAQQFHSAMRRIAPLRKMLGFRTIFNLLGPLTNPAGAGCVILGVYEPKLTEMFASVLVELGCKRAMVVHGYDGMDEITTTTRSRVTELVDGRLRTYDFFPELYLDGELASPEDLRGGDAKENAEILIQILEGKIRGAKRNIVLLNTAAALFCAKKSGSIEEGIKIAADSIDSGAAKEKLRQLVELSNRM